MKFLRYFSVVLASFLFCASAFAFESAKLVAVSASSRSTVSASSVAASPTASPAVLPSAFAGWEIKGPVARSADPASADEANAPVLREYGFVRMEKAAYTRDDGRNLTLKAAVFEDASGAYGAFTYYASEEMGRRRLAGRRLSRTTACFFIRETCWWMRCSTR